MTEERLGGAYWDSEGTTFVVWTTTTSDVAVRVLDQDGRPAQTERLRATDRPARYEGRIEGVPAGALYEILLDGQAVPDPFARFLPRGVHGPAQVLASRVTAPLASPTPLRAMTLYELHVGTFTTEGTYTAAADRLHHLVDLGVSAIELMPLAAFAGHHGWGYDGVALFAPHAPYGTPEELRAFVDRAHAHGLAVILDVVYNHFGPAGNYLSRYAPQYFTAHVKTPWGAGPDFTWPPMRRLVLDNVRYWLEEFGFDGLRLDATHAIQDDSERHILSDITTLAHEHGRIVFFEDERNDPAVIQDHAADAVWADDLHHQVHVLLTGERDGYYAAHEPTVSALAACIRDGWTYTGQAYAPWKGKPRGKPLGSVSRERLVTCLQNHDQVGNGASGTRLSSNVSIDAYCSATALLLFLPSTPLIFMGQEWAASSPFLYFSDHEGDLGRAVSEGRRKEFAEFSAFADPPDPQAKSTFQRSHLQWNEIQSAPHARVLDVYRALLRLRKNDLVLSGRGELHVSTDANMLSVIRRTNGGTRTLIVNFGEQLADVVVPDDARVLFQSSSAPIERTSGGCLLNGHAAVIVATP